MTMTRLHPRFAALALAAAFAVSGATFAATGAPAFAADLAAAPAPKAHVRYADLNLRSDEGLRRLEARVRTAAERLCPGSRSTALRERREGLACRDAAIAGAAPQVRQAVAAFAAASPTAIALTLGR